MTTLNLKSWGRIWKTTPLSFWKSHRSSYIIKKRNLFSSCSEGTWCKKKTFIFWPPPSCIVCCLNKRVWPNIWDFIITSSSLTLICVLIWKIKMLYNWQSKKETIQNKVGNSRWRNYQVLHTGINFGKISKRHCP